MPTPQIEAARAVVEEPREPAPATLLVDEPAPTILVARAHDPHRLARGARVSATVERAFARAGYRAGPSGRVEAARFIVSPTVHAVTVTRDARSTTISCRVTLRVAPWSRGERWEPHTTASATGEARASTGNARAQIELGIDDCLESAVDAATTREVIPFLRRCERAGCE